MIVFEEGQVFGRLTFLKNAERRHYGVFSCSCGVTKECKIFDVNSGKSQSCGCLRKDLRSIKSTKIDPGSTQGRLTVLGLDPERTTGGHFGRKAYFVRCECGREKSMLASNLLAGAKSCGKCMRSGSNNSNYRHGHADGTLDRRHRCMISRCYDPSDAGYVRYGARGITVCQEWREDATKYYEWVTAELDKLGWTLNAKFEVDRRDNSKGYSPENCRLVTKLQNANNTRTNVYFYNIFGVSETLTLSDAVRKYSKLGYGTVIGRVRKGWHIEKALTGGVNKSGRPLKNYNISTPLSKEERELFLASLTT